MSEADEKVERLVLVLFKGQNRDALEGSVEHHLRDCPGLKVAEGTLRAQDGLYDCGTCEYMDLKAGLICGHHEGLYTYGNFGYLAGLLEDLDELESNPDDWHFL